LGENHGNQTRPHIAYEESGPADGVPVILLHGFSYEPRGYDEMAPLSAASLEENKESAAEALVCFFKDLGFQ
jgi:hypothetical protein